MSPIRIAIVGLGKIALDQHLPSIRSSTAFELVAVASPHTRLDGVPSYASLDQMLEANHRVQAVAVCTPPAARATVAQLALRHGCHVLLEKPPGISVREVEAFSRLADERRLTLFASWHSRHGGAVEPARAWLAGRQVRHAIVTWKEDVRVWHPGQDWIWMEEGFGAFDPGINALSILTHILPGDIELTTAELQFPSNCESPSAARLSLTLDGAPVDFELDILHAGTPIWEVTVETDSGRLVLAGGGTTLRIDDRRIDVAPRREYADLYSHFSALIGARTSDVDLAPLKVVVDALAGGKRTIGPPFVEDAAH